MSETVAWLVPWSIVALYVVWGLAYDRRRLQGAKKDRNEEGNSTS